MKTHSLPGISCTTAALALLAAACGSPASPPPLIAHTLQKASSVCLPVPEKGPGLDQWNSPVGMAVGLYYNQSDVPITIQSVSLLRPHNLVLHSVEAYKMARYLNPLAQATAWSAEGEGVPASDWEKRQPVPGAVIPPGQGVIAPADFPAKRPDVYQFALEITAASPAGGWALGEVITYQAAGRTYAFTLLTGLAIGGARRPTPDPCRQPLDAIMSAFGSS